MLAMQLDLIGINFVVKCCAIWTVIRLLATAFGFEFGISCQYLRLLELVFEFGQRRIKEKVESRHKLHPTNQFDEETPPTSPKRPTTLSAISPVSSSFDCDGYKCEQEQSGVLRKRRNSNRDSSPVLANKSDNNQDGDDDEQDELTEIKRPIRTNSSMSPTAAAAATKTPNRRISTPDGPPIFLLDDDEFEDGVNDLGGNGEQSIHNPKHEFHLMDASKFVVRGISAIIDDEVTKRFTTEELKSWNLLTRNTGKNYQFMSRALGLYWLFGVLIRYIILLPMRIMFTVVGFLWLVCTMTLIRLIPARWRDKPYRLFSLMSMRMLACGITSRLKFHNRQYRARKGDICVANHTSPIDAVLLACDNCYALIGQRHGGLLGILEQALSSGTNHVWFDRGEIRDRQLVTQRLKEHVSGKHNLPVLIFPEGTCINNSAVMLFRKGAFETTDRVCPVAIKYDNRFGDPFWNSSKHGYLQYLLLMMSSWAIKCDVWYLPPMDRIADESPAEFANRVKAEIAKVGGLVDLNWDGQLKRSAPKVVWKYQQQEDYVKRLILE